MYLSILRKIQFDKMNIRKIEDNNKFTENCQQDNKISKHPQTHSIVG